MRKLIRPHRTGLVVLGTALACLQSGCSAPSAAVPAAQPLAIHSEAPTQAPITTWSEQPTPATTTAADHPSLKPRHTPAPSTPVQSVPATREVDPGNGTVLAQLESIPIKGRAPKTGYDRDIFGAGWKDPDRNGCDARNDILDRDLKTTTAKPGTHGCVITTGILQDPFTGKTISFVRGQGTSTKVQIDHVVALSDAWQKGAQKLEAAERLAFANDPLNLLAVDGPANASKGDGDAATWLPPNKGFRCDYVARQTAVKTKHGLWMTKAERDAIHRTITSQCPGKKALSTDN